ncbi:hypothetical protein EII29_11145 [Leptotrichia sp. OH3620_COT-345]|uniref:hypothetical protein n=1 Tax=Leptotrichia sp. OH3620_COT-345 TaxID=2491048 RepID=UPI000F64B965|nr:hypothetical protein [Leptotrichia sp. OH3620_COT-345]RRD37588.1 hypothetical protein EII29_11145 [Leptotrichia sp. OH3620_COT-345]
MKKRITIVILFFMIILINSYGSENLNNLKLQKIKSTSFTGGIDYILNDSSPYEMIFYFKLYDLQENTDSNKFFDENKEIAIKMFNSEYLHSHYTQEYIQLKNGEKFLYGKITAMPSYVGMLKLELYFIDKNNVEKKKVLYKKMDIEKESIYPILRKINADKTEGFSVALPYAEEIGIITEKKKIHKKINYNYGQFGNFSNEEIELYAYLLGFFKDEIPKEFLELKRKYLDEMMKD